MGERAKSNRTPMNEEMREEVLRLFRMLPAETRQLVLAIGRAMAEKRDTPENLTRIAQDIGGRAPAAIARFLEARNQEVDHG